MSKIAQKEEQSYRQHNVTRNEQFSDGRLKKQPVPPSLQCQCGDCRAHRKRNSQTGVADPNKDV